MKEKKFIANELINKLRLLRKEAAAESALRLIFINEVRKKNVFAFIH